MLSFYNWSLILTPPHISISLSNVLNPWWLSLEMASCLFKLRRTEQLSAQCPIRFLRCFLQGSQAQSHSSAWLSVATVRRDKQHFTTMSVTSTLHTNQRVCQRDAQLQRTREKKKKGRVVEMTIEKERQRMLVTSV